MWTSYWRSSSGISRVNGQRKWEYGEPINDPSLRALYRSTHVDEDVWMKFTAEREKKTSSGV